MPTLCPLPGYPLPTHSSAFPHHCLLGRELKQASIHGSQSRVIAMHQGQRQPWQDSRLWLSLCPPVAPASFGSEPVFPFLPKAFLQLQPSSLAAAGQQAGALSPTDDERRKSCSRWSSHPSSLAALVTQHGSCLEGKSSPSPPTGLRAGQAAPHPCRGKRIWGKGSWSATFPSLHPSKGFFCAPSLSTPSPAHSVLSLVLYPSL